MAIIKPVRVFSREHPCTKIELFNCFTGEFGYVRRPVVEARGEIGENAPKYLLQKNYCVYRTDKGIDYYELTQTGEEWLTKGVESHLKRHPDDFAKLEVKGATPAQPGKWKNTKLRTRPALPDDDRPEDYPSESTAERKVRIARTPVKRNNP